MMKVPIYSISLVVCLIFGYFMRSEASSLSFSDYKSLMTTLLNISAIIFAIIGAWIAIIYPSAIKQKFSPTDYKVDDFNKAIKQSAYLRELIEVVLVSALVLFCVLSADYFILILLRVNLTYEFVYYGKAIAFTVVSILTIWQLIAIVKVVKINFSLWWDLRDRVDEKEIDKMHSPGGRD